MEETKNWNALLAGGIGVAALALLLVIAGNVIPLNKLAGGADPNLASIPKPPEPITTESGLFMYDTKPGEGAEAKTGDTVLVHYTGTLTDGTQFDSSEGKDPFKFTIGKGEVIKGWDEGIAGMKVGAERVMIIPPELAYGKDGRPPVIPPDSVLQFEVKLVEIVGAAPAPAAAAE